MNVSNNYITVVNQHVTVCMLASFKRNKFTDNKVSVSFFYLSSVYFGAYRTPENIIKDLVIID